MHTDFKWGNLQEGYHVEDLGVDGSVVADLEELGWKGVDWIDVAQDTEPALVHAAIKLRIP
jgi:hypothetical protein